MNLRFTNLFIVAAIAFLPPPCLAYQSGSRSSTPAAAAPSNGIDSVPLGQPFSATQDFSPQPNVNASSPQSMSLSQQYATPAASSPTNMSTPQNAQAAGGGSSSLGIPNASLVDPIFQINDPHSSNTIDNSTWNCFLSKYLVMDTQGINRVRY